MTAGQRTAGSRVLRPGTPGYEEARRPAIARFADVRPAAVALCGSSAEVADALALARGAGLPVAVRSGGHCFAGRSSTEGVVVDVSPMRSVAVGAGDATIGAGARLEHVYAALDAHGLTIPAGCGPGVGISGLALGGGLGLLGRSHGLTCDALLAAEVVLADGRVVVCDDERHPDLLWALRGAGGGFGVVTSLRLRTVAAPEATGFELRWPAVAAPALLAAWQDWAPAAPDGLAASLLVTAGGGEPAAAKAFGAMTGGDPGPLLDELVVRAGVAPVSDSRHAGSYREVKRFLVGLGEDGDDAAHPYSKSGFFAAPLPPDAAGALIDHFLAGPPGVARELDFTPWGGAYNRPRGDATAFAHRDARFLLKHAAVVRAPGEAPAARAWLDESWRIVHPFGTGGVYPNFPDPDLPDPDRAYHGGNAERVAALKARFDPDGVFDALLA